MGGTRDVVFLDVNGVRLHTLVFGDGPRTLLAVGGWTGSWEVWEEPIAQLTARGWRCVAYDHRGSGESPVDPALISVEAMVDDVAGVLDALQVEVHPRRRITGRCDRAVCRRPRPATV